MKIEHAAWNVPDPNACARWYVEHLGFTIKKKFVDPPYGHFLADDSGTVMIELYCRTDAAVPDYPNQHPGVTHLAMVSKDVEADVARLVKAGGKLWNKVDYQPNGDILAFVQDPWGFTLQFVKRAQPLI